MEGEFWEGKRSGAQLKVRALSPVSCFLVIFKPLRLPKKHLRGPSSLLGCHRAPPTGRAVQSPADLPQGQSVTVLSTLEALGDTYLSQEPFPKKFEGAGLRVCLFLKLKS